MNRLLIALLLVCGTSSAGETGGVDAFLSNFYADFNGRKIERLSSEYFHPGAQAVFGEHVTVLADQDDVKQMSLRFSAAWKSAGTTAQLSGMCRKYALGRTMFWPRY
jgi:hypothetical protein